MADIADIANDAHLASLELARAAHTGAPERRADFCDCDSWGSCRQFCGDAACRDAYEAEDRHLAMAAGGRSAAMFVVRAAR